MRLIDPWTALYRRRFAAATISGAMLGLSFPPFPFPVLAAIALVPLLKVWDESPDGRSAFSTAYVAFLVTFAVAFQWPLFHAFTTTALLSLPPLLILPMWMAAPFGVTHTIRRRLGRRVGLIALAATYVLMEWGLRTGPLAFPWPLIGHTQAAMPPVNGLAALGGVPLLTLFLLALNGLIYAGVRRGVRPVPALLACAVLPLLPFVTNDGGSAFRLSGHGATHAPETVRVAGIQPSPTPESWADLDDSSRVSTLLDLSRVLLERADRRPDLIVWPETAIPPRPNPSSYVERLQSFSDSAGVPVLAGAITTGLTGAAITTGSTAGAAYRNSALLVVPRAAIQRYDKVNLVPFAERVPFAGTIPYLERLAIPAGGIQGYEPGKSRGIFEITGHRLGVLICFETLFAASARDHARAGVRAIVAITQDGWWGDSFGYRQHLSFNRLRSIETGLPLLQASVSGVSALISPDGRVLELAGWMERATWQVDVPRPEASTPYVQYGEWVTVLALIVALGIAAVHVFHRGSGGISQRIGEDEDEPKTNIMTTLR